MEFPETCVDDASVNRGAIHEAIGAAAFTFFNESLAQPRAR